jgi:hypothetical protein
MEIEKMMNTIGKSIATVAALTVLGPTTCAHLNDSVDYYSSRYSSEDIRKSCDINESEGVFNPVDYKFSWADGDLYGNNKESSLFISTCFFRSLPLTSEKRFLNDYNLDGLVDQVSINKEANSGDFYISLDRKDDYSEYKTIFDNADQELAEFMNKHYDSCHGY